MILAMEHPSAPETPKAKAPVKTPEPPIADGVLFGPDGMPLDNNAVVEEDQEGQLHAKITSHQKVASRCMWGMGKQGDMKVGGFYVL